MAEKETKKLIETDQSNDPGSPKMWDRILKSLGPFSRPVLAIINLTIVPGTLIANVRLAVTLFAALAQSLVVSFQVAFNIPTNDRSYVINQIASVILVSDIVLNFFTTFTNKDGKMVYSKQEIARRYLRGHFILDVLSNFPIEWFTGNSDWLLIRVLIIHKPIVWIQDRQKLLNMSLAVEVSKYALLLLYIIHFYSCIWWVIGIPASEHTHTWSFPEESIKVTQINLHSDTMRTEYTIQYFYSVYWVLNVVTVPGYADLEAPSLTEKIVGLFMFLSGLVILGYLAASVTSILANRGAQKARHQQKLISLCQFMDDNSISLPTQERVKRYYNYLWSRNKGIDSKSIFEDFPSTFQAELALDINGTLLAKVPLFQNTEIGFMRMLSLALQPVLFLPMEYVVRKGDIGTEMFFIHKGSVDVVSDDGSKVFASMLEGSFFGEIALFFSRPRTANIRSATYCDIYVLSKNDLNSVLEFYPSVRESILKEASERLKENFKRNNITMPIPPPTAASTSGPRTEAMLTSEAKTSDEAPPLAPAPILPEQAPPLPLGIPEMPAETASSPEHEKEELKDGHEAITEHSIHNVSHSNLVPLKPAPEVTPERLKSSHVLAVEDNTNDTTPIALNDSPLHAFANQIEIPKKKGSHAPLAVDRDQKTEEKNEVTQGPSNPTELSLLREEEEFGNLEIGSKRSLYVTQEEAEEILYDHLSRTRSITMGGSIYGLNAQPPEPEVPQESSSDHLNSASKSLGATVSRRVSVAQERMTNSEDETMMRTLDIVLHANINGGSTRSTNLIPARRASSRPFQIRMHHGDIDRQPASSVPSDPHTEWTNDVPLHVRRRYSYYEG